MKDGSRAIYNNEGKDDMITQKIKRWFDRLFAWWPWKRSPEIGYAQAVSNLNTSATQEPMLRSTVDGPVPQAGSTSVAVEQVRDEDIPELSRPTTEERPEKAVSSHPSLAEESSNKIPLKPEATKGTAEIPPPSSTPEQRLAFLQYLVKRGTVNEGFGEGQIPKQYKKSRS